MNAESTKAQDVRAVRDRARAFDNSNETQNVGDRSEHVETTASVAECGENFNPRSTGVRGRRALFTALATVAATTWRKSAMAEPLDVPYDADPQSLVPKLVRRITMGITPTELALAESLGYSGYLEYQLNYTAIDDSAVQASLAALTTLTNTFVELEALPQNQIGNELIEAAMRRAIFGKRQLFERMVELWTDHFNISIGDNYSYKAIDDRNVIRPNALGLFPTLLRASAHSPAMLYYLNNDTNVKTSPNENYARELMELHTLGSEGGYTQNDVKEVARCLTGWTIYRGPTGDPLNGTFLYRDTNHDKNQKVVLGNIIPSGGNQSDGETVLNILLDHPSTAKYVSTKLCSWLLSPTVQQSVINSVAATYTATGGDIRAMIRTALKPTNLLLAAPKLKRPWHLMTSALRALPATLTSSSSLRNDLFAGGHQPFLWATPDGYPDKTNYWAGNPLWRWSHGAQIGASSYSGLTVDFVSMFSGATTADAVVDRINQRLFAGAMPASDKLAVRTYVAVNPTNARRQSDGVGLAIGSPGFQWF